MDTQDMEIDEPLTPHISEDEDGGNVSDCYDSSSAELQYLESTTVLKQLETEAITVDQLITEKDTIYASLIKIEGKCIAVCERYIERDPSNSEWQEMLSLHQTLVYQHLNLFLVTQHPSANTELKGFPKENKMAARLWIHGIHSFLELLRKRLPGSQENMLSFFCFVYTTMTILLESVNGFGETWIECLGDLARYRMAMEGSNMRTRNTWAGVSRHWYNAVADCSPEEGRIQHHLAVLARPDLIRQLFHYTKALMSVRPFRQTRESMVHLFSASNAQDTLNEHKITTSFIAVHAALFNKLSSDRFIHLANHFLFHLREEPRLLGHDGQTGVYIMSCNLASILEYGDPKTTLEMDFGKKDCALFVVPSNLSLDLRSASGGKDHSQQVGGPTDPSVHLPPTTARASALAFHTLSILLDNIDGHNFYASAHISMSFVWSLAAHPTTMQQVYKVIPWDKVVTFLNSLIGPETKISTIEDRAFPLDGGVARQLPEDFDIRGQLWSQEYFPNGFFDVILPEVERKGIEQRSITILRMHRCLWLGVRISTIGDWITYKNRKFDITKYASTYALIAESYGGLCSKPLEPCLAPITHVHAE